MDGQTLWQHGVVWKLSPDDLGA